MQSVSSRIWTRVAVSISYDDNHYTFSHFDYKFQAFMCGNNKRKNRQLNPLVWTINIIIAMTSTLIIAIFVIAVISK